MRFRILVIVGLAIAACNLPGMPAMFSGKSTTQQTSSATTTTSENHTINGHPVDRDGNREDVEPAKKVVAEAPAGKKMGATCHKNAECSSEACLTGYGDLGYCTKICDSWSDCPSFWECKRPAKLNAPQKICMQPKD